MRLKPWKYPVWMLLCAVTGLTARAQKDSLPPNTIDSLLLKQKGMFKTIAQILLADTAYGGEKPIQRADLPFLKYNNRVIRHIMIPSSRFSVVMGDTSRWMNHALTSVANGLHSNTRDYTIRNHLFFEEGDRVSPFLMGNNERYLRDLPFLQDAIIRVRPVKGSLDSVDVVVMTSDVFSVGGTLAVSGTDKRVQLREDNFMGWGDRIEVQTLYNRTRLNNFGFGAEYTRRNVMGSFVDASVGYLNFNPSMSSRMREERVAFFRVVKPLVNPFMRWTYAFNAEMHTTSNMFSPDSLYHRNFEYKYRVYDAWAGWNPVAYDTKSPKEYERLRFLVSARMISQQFHNRPLEFRNRYHYAYANMNAFLASVSVFRLNFYKTKYVYGFGRNEDLPEGIEASFTTGLIDRAGRKRHYMGLHLQRYFLNSKEQYLDYSLRLASSIHRKAWEDITVLANVDFFSPLHEMGKWKQRSFLNASMGFQVNPLLDEPMFLESGFGLPQFNNNLAAGHMRTTVRAESVFFSPWSLLYFKIAPFVFSSATLFKTTTEMGGSTNLYPALGGGIRTRNESLVFGTIELRGTWLPRRDLLNNSYLLNVNTNIRFKYKQNFIRRPELIQVN
jgi:hypothetical protein